MEMMDYRWRWGLGRVDVVLFLVYVCLGNILVSLGRTGSCAKVMFTRDAVMPRFANLVGWGLSPVHQACLFDLHNI